MCAAPRVLVLGGAGFLGANLAVACVRQGRAVTVLDRRAPAPRNLAEVAGRVRYLQADFHRHETWRDALAEAELVFHCVCTTIPGSSNADPARDLEENALATLALLEAMRRRPARLVFLSSGGTVYGVPRRLPIPEDHPTDPICAYGIHKLAIEKYLALYERLHGLDYRIARLSNPYGPRQDPAGGQGVVTAFLERVRAGRPLEVWGDGSVERDFFYVGDAVRGLLALADHAGPERVFNFGSGRALSVRALIERIGEATGARPEVRWLPARGEDVPCNTLDTSRAQAVLGWRPEVELPEGLRLTLEWLRGRA